MTDATTARTSGDAGAGPIRTITQRHQAQIRKLDGIATALKRQAAAVRKEGAEEGREFTLDDRLVRALEGDTGAVQEASAQLANTLDAIRRFEEALEDRADAERDEAEDRQRDEPPVPPRTDRRPPRVPPVRTGPRPEPDDPSEFVEPIVVPKLERPSDMMYRITGDRVTRMSDGSQVTGKNSPGTNALRDAYAQGREGLITIGIAGPALGGWSIGGSNSMWSPDGVCALHEDIPVELGILGLTDDAEISRVLFTNLQKEVHDLQFWDLGLRANPDPYIVKGLGEVGMILLDGCWWLPHPSYQSNGRLHRSGFTTSHGFDGIIVRNQKRKTNLLTEEHDYYFKGGGSGGMGDRNLGGMIALVDNELGVGNRTWFQIRPHGNPSVPGGSGTPSQDGPILIRGNHGKDFARGHGNPSGGSLMTIWTSRGRTIIEDNVAEGDNRYGCLAVTQGGADTGVYLTPDGYSHAATLIRNNHLSNPNGDRSCVEISAADRVWLAGENEFDGGTNADVVLNSQFASKLGAKPNRSVKIIGKGGLAPGSRVMTYADGQHQTLTDEQVEAMRIAS